MNQKLYFPNLNGLRFIAAFSVMIHHTEQIKSWFGYRNYFSNSTVFIIGKLGVILFFVLSGFLITYLLLVEKAQKKTVSVRKFYIRRILRIWPLYYFIVLLGFFVLSRINFLNISNGSPDIFKSFYWKFSLFVLFLPNLEVYLLPGFTFASHTWSVGVEEQFYLIWPHVIKRVKKMERFFCGIIIFYVGSKLALIVIKKVLHIHNELFDKLQLFYDNFTIDCMAIGALFAFMHYNQRKVVKFIFNKYVEIANILCLLVLIFNGITIPYIHYEVYSFLFAILILNVSTNPNTIVNLENPVFNYLGKISYGLYMYHLVIVFFTIKVLIYFKIDNLFLQYAIILLCVTGVAGFSYRYFESYFLRLKEKVFS